MTATIRSANGFLAAAVLALGFAVLYMFWSLGNLRDAAQQAAAAPAQVQPAAVIINVWPGCPAVSSP